MIESSVYMGKWTKYKRGKKLFILAVHVLKVVSIG